MDLGAAFFPQPQVVLQRNRGVRRRPSIQSAEILDTSDVAFHFAYYTEDKWTFDSAERAAIELTTRRTEPRRDFGVRF